MNTEKRTEIIKDLKAYLGSGGEITSTEQSIWNDILKKRSYQIARKAFKILFKEKPPCETYGKLPDSRRFEEILEEISLPAIKECSCCGGSTFLVFINLTGEGKTYDCVCYINAGMPPRTKSFLDLGFSECDSLDCPNPEKKETITVPQGSWKYYKKKLKTCKFIRVITEERAVDISNNKEKNIPF